MIFVTPHGIAAFDLYHAEAVTRFMAETGAARVTLMAPPPSMYRTPPTSEGGAPLVAL